MNPTTATANSHPTPPPGLRPEGEPFFQPGHNCWQIAAASRAHCIVDASEYFRLFAEACCRAREQILILGWDFDRRERLFRDQGPDDLPWQAGEFLSALVRRRRALHLYLLSWDFHMLYAAEREFAPALRLRLQAPRRFHFKLDGHHPVGASHHQKVVVIDDRVAFVGGIDLSRWRWDTPEHAAEDPRRRDADGKPYPPYHDVMLMVEGQAAAQLGNLARTRWRRGLGRRLKPPSRSDGEERWPASVEAHFRDVELAIARTEPRYRRRSAVHEVRQLYCDAIRAARRFIYVENQYFTARCIADALAARLEEAEGPEVILVLPQKTGGWLEQMTMDVLRVQVCDRLRAADRHGRLRIYYPHVPGLGAGCLSVHSKLMIVDDLLLRIGSANLSSRSMGLDTECDLAVLARSADDAVAEGIRQLRRALLAEHLGAAPQQLGEGEASTGGLIAAVESLRCAERSLRDLELTAEALNAELLPDAGLIDPPEPLNPDYFLEQYVPRSDRRRGRRRLLVFLFLIGGLLALAAAWRWTPLGDWLSPERMRDWLAAFHNPLARAAVAIAGFLVASVLMVPLILLAVFGGLVFGGVWGFVYVLAAALASAALVFLLGRFLSRDAVERLSGSRLRSLSRRLADRGVLAVAVLRLIPVAPFTVFNLVAGASHVRFRHFLLGSLLGLAPGIAALTLFSNSLWAAIQNPSWQSLLVVAGFAVVIILAIVVMRRWLRSG